MPMGACIPGLGRLLSCSWRLRLCWTRMMRQQRWAAAAAAAAAADDDDDDFAAAAAATTPQPAHASQPHPQGFLAQLRKAIAAHPSLTAMHARYKRAGYVQAGLACLHVSCTCVMHVAHLCNL